MAVYARKTNRQNPIFQSRSNTIVDLHGEVTAIPVPNDVTLCNGCNGNIADGYLVYLDKVELKANRPYDYYCLPCLKRYFKGYKEVE